MVSENAVFGYGLFDFARTHWWYKKLQGLLDYSCNPAYFYPVLEFLLEENHVPKDGSFLDMGAGQGFMVMGATKMGLNAYGIEKSYTRAATSQMLIRIAKKQGVIPKDSRCKTTQGTFFSREYGEFRKSGKSIAPAIEGDDFRSEYLSRYLYTRGSDRAYSRLGLRPGEVDLFFLYNENFAFYSAAEFFSRHAREGAIFFLRTSPPKHYQSCRDKLSLEEISLPESVEGSAGSFILRKPRQ